MLNELDNKATNNRMQEISINQQKTIFMVTILNKYTGFNSDFSITLTTPSVELPNCSKCQCKSGKNHLDKD